MLFFINGCAAAVFTLNHKETVGRYLQKLKDFFGYKDYVSILTSLVLEQ